MIVTIVIPTKNSGKAIERCLRSIKNQSWTDIETIVVDAKSADGTPETVKKYAKLVTIDTSKVPPGHFTATYQRNYGASVASGEFIYYVDADMILTKDVVSDCVKTVTQNGYDALVVPEDSFGKGFWADCKRLERRCYWGDSVVEAPRFVKKTVWDLLGGLDEEVGGGGDDWDLRQKLLEKGYRIGRIRSVVMHDEGQLSLTKLVRKRFMYGKDVLKYLKKRKGTAATSYLPLRRSFIKNWRLFAHEPLCGSGVVFMRTVEYISGFLGIVVSALER